MCGDEASAKRSPIPAEGVSKPSMRCVSQPAARRGRNYSIPLSPSRTHIDHVLSALTPFQRISWIESQHRPDDLPDLRVTKLPEQSAKSRVKSKTKTSSNRSKEEMRSQQQESKEGRAEGSRVGELACGVGLLLLLLLYAVVGAAAAERLATNAGRSKPVFFFNFQPVKSRRMFLEDTTCPSLMQRSSGALAYSVREPTSPVVPLYPTSKRQCTPTAVRAGSVIGHARRRQPQRITKKNHSRHVCQVYYSSTPVLGLCVFCGSQFTLLPVAS